MTVKLTENERKEGKELVKQFVGSEKQLKNLTSFTSLRKISDIDSKMCIKLMSD